MAKKIIKRSDVIVVDSAEKSTERAAIAAKGTVPAAESAYGTPKPAASVPAAEPVPKFPHVHVGDIVNVVLPRRGRHGVAYLTKEITPKYQEGANYICLSGRVFVVTQDYIWFDYGFLESHQIYGYENDPVNVFPSTPEGEARAQALADQYNKAGGILSEDSDLRQARKLLAVMAAGTALDKVVARFIAGAQRNHLKVFVAALGVDPSTLPKGEAAVQAARAAYDSSLKDEKKRATLETAAKAAKAELTSLVSRHPAWGSPKAGDVDIDIPAAEKVA